MDDIFDDFIGMAVLLFMAFGAVVGAVVLFLMILPYLLMGAAVAALGYGLFKLVALGWAVLLDWNWRRINSVKHVAKKLDADHAAAKQSMFDLSDKPWQKLVN